MPKNLEYIFVIDNPKHFSTIEPRIPREARKDFRKAYAEDPTSMALTYGTFDLVIISISLKEESYLKTNKKALVGLLAHELMHIRQRRRNLDRSIRADAIRSFNKFHTRLYNLKIPQKILANFFAQIGESANYTLKDIYANFELIDNGVGEYILEDYFNLYKFGERFAKPVFYSTKDSNYNLIQHVQQAIDFELNLISAIAPFVKMARSGNKRAEELVTFIAKNYEINISEVANAYDDVIQYAIDKFSWTGQYRRRFFTIVFKRALFLLENLELEYKNIQIERKTKSNTKRKEILIEKPIQINSTRKRVLVTKRRSNSRKRKTKSKSKKTS
jgi:hypothetical protein